MLRIVWICVVVLLIQLAIAEDYYKILGVGRDASEKDIKKAYRRLSREYHPDKNPGNDEAAQKFVEIAGAYEVLSDKEQRAIYDRYGEDGLKNQGRGGHHGDMKNAFDMFRSFFGGGHPFGAGGRRVQRGPDVQTTLECDLKTMYEGGTIDFSLNLQGVCDECDGTGSADGKEHTCDVCGGQGIRIVRHQLAPGMFQQIQTPCDKCGGKGKVISHPCKVCGGAKVVREERQYHVYVEPGSAQKFEHRIPGEADMSPDWETGDLLVHVVEARRGNMGYRRKGRNLFRTEVLSMKEALKGGWSRSIPFIDGSSKVNLTRNSGVPVSNGEVERIKGWGMPPEPEHDHEHDHHHSKHDKYGDLYIDYVVIPAGGKKDLHDEL
uniref:ARAD1D15180p n=1 Tax=Blastobotrys adeninivorans TaxID=409370 RepID=A0A060TFG4_BLAAD